MELKRAEQLAETLEQAVFKGAYKDGQRLDEIKLAEQFNVSRTPIREALQRLVLSGMAEQKPSTVDNRTQTHTFEDFISWVTRRVIVILLILVFMAIFAS
mgnify:CR=1 FL=1